MYIHIRRSPGKSNHRLTIPVNVSIGELAVTLGCLRASEIGGSKPLFEGAGTRIV